MEPAAEDPVITLRRLYRQMVPAAKLSSLLEMLTSYENQQAVFNQVILDPLVVKYPPSLKYQQRILKEFVEILQRSGEEEILDDLLDHFMSLGITGSISHSDDDLLRDSAMREISFRTYSLPNNKTVTVRLAEQLDQVGLTTWEAGLYLAELIVAHPHLFRDRECLELGSGIGFTGLVLAKAGGCSRVVLTDYTDPVMRNLRLNIDSDGIECELDAFEMDWERDTVDTLSIDPTLILAADVVYDIDAVRALCVVLKQLLSSKSKSGLPREALVATTRRNPKTLEFFLEELSRVGIVQDDVTQTYPVPQLFAYTRTSLLLSRLSIPGAK